MTKVTVVQRQHFQTARHCQWRIPGPVRRNAPSKGIPETRFILNNTRSFFNPALLPTIPLQLVEPNFRLVPNHLSGCHSPPQVAKCMLVYVSDRVMDGLELSRIAPDEAVASSPSGRDRTASGLVAVIDVLKSRLLLPGVVLWVDPLSNSIGSPLIVCAFLSSEVY